MLFFFCITDFFFHSVIMCSLIIYDLLPLFLLSCLVHHLFILNLPLFSLCNCHLLLLIFKISFSLTNDFSCLLSCLIDLFVGFDLLFLKKCNSISQKLKIFLCLFSCLFCPDELLMKDLVSVFFVWNEVNVVFFELIFNSVILEIILLSRFRHVILVVHIFYILLFKLKLNYIFEFF